MNILTANIIKQHGVEAIVKQMQYGPVHVFKHNHPLFVVISENEYQQLTQKNHNSSGLLMMLNKNKPGERQKEDIDKQLQQERDEWD